MTGSVSASRRDVLRLAAATGAAGLLASPRIALAAEPVRIVNSAGNFLLVMQQMLKPFLSEFGVDAVFTNATDNTLATASLVSGDADISTYAAFNLVPIAVEKGAPLKVVAAASLVPFQAMFAKRPDIKTMKDLEGKTVGVGALGAAAHQQILTLFKKKGVDASKVTFRNVGSPTDIFRAVVAGVIDAGPATIEAYEKQEQFGVHSLSDGEFWVELPEYTSLASYTSDRAIAAKRDQLVRVLAAHAKFYRFMQNGNSRDAFVKTSTDVLGDKPDVIASATFQSNFFQKHKPFASDLVLSEERIRFVEELNIASGAQSKNVPIDRLCDMSLARDAIKLLG